MWNLIRPNRIHAYIHRGNEWQHPQPNETFICDVSRDEARQSRSIRTEHRCKRRRDQVWNGSGRKTTKERDQRETADERMIKRTLNQLHSRTPM